MTKQNYIKQYLPLAQKAGERFGMNPIIILAQSAIETGWGESSLAKEYNNFFGITAYGRPNPFWDGGRTDLSATGGRPALWFRRYLTAEDSFLDFARLIHSAYPVAAHAHLLSFGLRQGDRVQQIHQRSEWRQPCLLISVCWYRFASR